MNNKQSSIELFIEQLEEKGGAWENVSIRRVQISIDVSEYMELKQQAKAMHKEEVIEARVDGDTWSTAIKEMRRNYAELYYNETFNTHENNNRI